MRRVVLLFLFLSLVFSFTVKYQDKVMVEYGKKLYYKLEITSDQSGSYSITVDSPSCLELEGDKTIDLGYIDKDETRILYLEFKNGCTSISHLKLKVEGPGGEKNLDILVIPYKDPVVRVSREKIIYGIINDVEIGIDFDGDKVCIQGDWIGPKEVCSTDGRFSVRILGDVPGLKVMPLTIKVTKEGYEYNITKSVSFFVEDPEINVVVKNKFIFDEGYLDFDICENCMICIYSKDMYFDRACSKDKFYYKYFGEEDEVTVYYTLLKQVFGEWRMVNNGTISLEVRREGKVDIVNGGYEKGYYNLYLVNPTDKDVEDVFIKVGDIEKYYGKINAHDYEIIKLERPGCYNYYLKYNSVNKSGEVCFKSISRDYSGIVLFFSGLVLGLLPFILKKVI